MTNLQHKSCFRVWGLSWDWNTACKTRQRACYQGFVWHNIWQSVLRRRPPGALIILNTQKQKCQSLTSAPTPTCAHWLQNKTHKLPNTDAYRSCAWKDARTRTPNMSSLALTHLVRDMSVTLKHTHFPAWHVCAHKYSCMCVSSI